MGSPKTIIAGAPRAPGEAAADLRTRLLQSATSLFSERGYAATSMRAVAEGAGCTKPNLYYHFGSKEALFAECVGEAGQCHVRALVAAFGGPGTVVERLRAALGAVFELLREDPTGLRLVYTALESPDPAQPLVDAGGLRSAPLTLTGQLLQEGIAAGEVRPDLSVDNAVLALMGMVDHRCRRLVFEDEPIPPDCPERLVDIFFNGVGK